VYLSTGVDKIHTHCALAVCLVVASKVKVDGFVLGHVLNLVTHVGYHTLLRSGIFGKFTRTHDRWTPLRHEIQGLRLRGRPLYKGYNGLLYHFCVRCHVLDYIYTRGKNASPEPLIEAAFASSTYVVSLRKGVAHPLPDLGPFSVLLPPEPITLG
jgi:hypothetical protein